MKILFLDQSGKLGGAELCLADIAQHFDNSSLVGVFDEGPFPEHLRSRHIPVKVFSQQAPQVKKASGLLTGLNSVKALAPLSRAVAQTAKNYDVIYANTQKALVVGAIASSISRRPLVYHLHDIISPEHFSTINRRIIITLANRAKLVIANSQASRDAFIQMGGRSDTIHVVYNGFHTERYGKTSQIERQTFRNALLQEQQLDENAPFIVGHFSRLSPWKGQHVLIEALQHCSENVVALLVGDALFGEADYVEQLKKMVNTLGLEQRVKFLGFRSDIPELMMACDAIAHTSTAAEPFGRVIVEAMLSGTPVVAAAAGGAKELVVHGQTGWLTPPGDAKALANMIERCTREESHTIAQASQANAIERFNIEVTNHTIAKLLSTHVGLYS